MKLSYILHRVFLSFVEILIKTLANHTLVHKGLLQASSVLLIFKPPTAEQMFILLRVYILGFYHFSDSLKSLFLSQ